MATEYDNYKTNDDAQAQAHDTRWIAQTFTTTIQYDISSVKLKLWRDPSLAPGTVTVSIRATDASDHPTDVDLCSGTIDGDTLPTTAEAAEWREITFDSFYTLSASTKYAIVIRCTGTGNYPLNWRDDASSPTYTTGNYEYSTDSGSSWNSLTSADMMFACWGAGGSPVDKTYSKKLITIGNHRVFYESSAGTMTELTAAQTNINTTLPLRMFEAYQKIFIANKSYLRVVDFGNVKLHTDDILPAGAYPRHGTVIEATGGAASGAKMVVDYITVLDGNCYVYGKRITTETFEDTDVCTATISEGDVSFTIDADEVAGPHWYNWTPYGNDSAYGSLPDKAILGCNYRGRCVLSGNSDYPYQWYMSRQANPWDWVYSSSDAQSPVAGGNSDAGEIGDIITALIPYKDDYLIFGCVNSIWYLTGDPMEGGSLNELDLTTGIYGSRAYCWDGEGNLYFWGTNGIYKTAIPGRPVCISEIRLPKLVGDESVNPLTYRITFAYDRRRVGILIFITKLSDGSNSNYWLDLRTNGFFPESYPDECGVFSAFYYEATDPDYRKLLLGCTDGYLRFYDDSAKDDDAGVSGDIAINSHIKFGPIPMSQDPDKQGKLSGLNLITAGGGTGESQSDSDNVNFKMFAENSAEKVIEKLYTNTNPKIAGIFIAPGRRPGARRKQKVKGAYLGIRLDNTTSDETWGFEKLFGTINPSGRLK